MKTKIVPKRPEVENGNSDSTSLKKSKQSTSYYYWFFTWNNYPDNFESIIVPIFQKICKRYNFQQEIGKLCKTPHLQGNIQLIRRQRMTAMVKMLPIHWEDSRNIEACFNYCIKNDETRDPNGKQFIFPTPPKPLRVITELRPWQKKIEDLIKTDPDDRSIYWFYETQGNVGKSAFTKYLVHHYKALFCCGGKFNDLINLIFNNNMDECNIIVFDIPRNHGGNISYDTLECIKNGMVCNTKYETGTKLFNPPHVIVFANELPSCPDKLSTDRWIVEEITSK